MDSILDFNDYAIYMPVVCSVVDFKFICSNRLLFYIVHMDGRRGQNMEIIKLNYGNYDT